MQRASLECEAACINSLCVSVHTAQLTVVFDQLFFEKVSYWPCCRIKSTLPTVNETPTDFCIMASLSNRCRLSAGNSIVVHALLFLNLSLASLHGTCKSHPQEMVAVIALVSMTYKLTYKHTNMRSPCNMLSSIVSFVGIDE